MEKNEQQEAFVTFNRNRDVVFSILDKLELIELLQFAEVCKEWLALSKDYKLTAQRWSHQVVPTTTRKIWFLTDFNQCGISVSATGICVW